MKWKNEVNNSRSSSLLYLTKIVDSMNAQSMITRKTAFIRSFGKPDEQRDMKDEG